MSHCRDDIDHKGEPINWGQWAITCDDPDFSGQGSQDTGEDYGPAPGILAAIMACKHHVQLLDSEPGEL